MVYFNEGASKLWLCTCGERHFYEGGELVRYYKLAVTLVPLSMCLTSRVASTIRRTCTYVDCLNCLASLTVALFPCFTQCLPAMDLLGPKCWELKQRSFVHSRIREQNMFTHLLMDPLSSWFQEIVCFVFVRS